MHFLSLVWTVIIFLFIAGLFMPSESSHFWDILIYIIVAVLIIVILKYSKSEKLNNKYENMSAEEKEKQKKLDEIREWSRRNKC